MFYIEVHQCHSCHRFNTLKVVHLSSKRYCRTCYLIQVTLPSKKKHSRWTTTDNVLQKDLYSARNHPLCTAATKHLTGWVKDAFRKKSQSFCHNPSQAESARFVLRSFDFMLLIPISDGLKCSWIIRTTAIQYKISYISYFMYRYKKV